jgi:hypothetical protein
MAKGVGQQLDVARPLGEDEAVPTSCERRLHVVDDLLVPACVIY